MNLFYLLNLIDCNQIRIVKKDIKGNEPEEEIYSGEADLYPGANECISNMYAEDDVLVLEVVD